MDPFFPQGAFVLAWSWFKTLKVGDVVVAKNNNLLILKRIKKIKNGGFFLIGDNEKESTDSRYFGFLEKKDILGKVILKFNA